MVKFWSRWVKSQGQRRYGAITHLPRDVVHKYQSRRDNYPQCSLVKSGLHNPRFYFFFFFFQRVRNLRPQTPADSIVTSLFTQRPLQTQINIILFNCMSGRTPQTWIVFLQCDCSTKYEHFWVFLNGLDSGHEQYISAIHVLFISVKLLYGCVHHPSRRDWGPSVQTDRLPAAAPTITSRPWMAALCSLSASFFSSNKRLGGWKSLCWTCDRTETGLFFGATVCVSRLSRHDTLNIEIKPLIINLHKARTDLMICSRLRFCPSLRGVESFQMLSWWLVSIVQEKKLKFSAVINFFTPLPCG